MKIRPKVPMCRANFEFPVLEAYYGEPYTEAKRLADMAPQDFCTSKRKRNVLKPPVMIWFQNIHEL